MEQEVLTKREAAQLLRTSEKGIDYMIAHNLIPFSRFGLRSVRFSRERLLQWLRQREGIEYRRRRQGVG